MSILKKNDRQALAKPAEAKPAQEPLSDKNTRAAKGQCILIHPKIRVVCTKLRDRKQACGIANVKVALNGEAIGPTNGSGESSEVKAGVVEGPYTATTDTAKLPTHRGGQSTVQVARKHDHQAIDVEAVCLLVPSVRAIWGGNGVPGVGVKFGARDLAPTDANGVAELKAGEAGFEEGNYTVALDLTDKRAVPYQLRDPERHPYPVKIQDGAAKPDPHYVQFDYTLRKKARPWIEVVVDNAAQTKVPDVGVKLHGPGGDYTLRNSDKNGKAELQADVWIPAGRYDVAFTLPDKARVFRAQGKEYPRYRLVPNDPPRTPYIDVAEGEEAVKQFKLKDLGALIVEVFRYDGQALARRVQFDVKNGPDKRDNVETEKYTGETVDLSARDPRLSKGPKAAGRKQEEDRKVLEDLEAGLYAVKIRDLAQVLLDQKKIGSLEDWHIAPEKTGEVKVKIAGGQVARVKFTLTKIQKIQFIAFNCTPGVKPGGKFASQQLYLGKDDADQDIGLRCIVTKNAIEEAFKKHTHPQENCLKVFMAPEFYFRGAHGAYPVEKIGGIMDLLRETTGNDKYKDWLFVYGTALAYLKHGEAETTRLDSLEVAGAPVGNVVTVQSWTDKNANPKNLQNPDIVHSAKICARIPAGYDGSDPDYKWKLGNAVITTRPAERIDPVAGIQYDLTTDGSVTFNQGQKVDLMEPASTEVFNIALVQKGGSGAGQAGLREAIIYKENVSHIDFLGAFSPNKYTEFHDAAGKGRKIEIHGQQNRPVLPTSGAQDVRGADPNVASPDGPSEVNDSGMGGGSLFVMDGINFGLEVCRDHSQNRLGNYYQGNAHPGDPKPQVLLIPSWGMSIAGGSVPVLPNGLVFNVDGPAGSSAGAANGNPRYVCKAHPLAVSNTPAKCGYGNHYACYRSEDKAGILCPCCNKIMGKNYEWACPAKEHVFTPAAANCARCGAVTTTVYICNTHGRRPGSPCSRCGLPLAPSSVCTGKHALQPGQACPVCGKAAVAGRIFYQCGPHGLSAIPMRCACGEKRYRMGRPPEMTLDMAEPAASSTPLPDLSGAYHYVASKPVPDPEGGHIEYSERKSGWFLSRSVTPSQKELLENPGSITVYEWLDVPEAEAV